jgi:hypothetical protein
MDETYIKVRGEWGYLYCAVDKHGRTVDCRLSNHRDIEAAKQFFRQALHAIAGIELIRRIKERQFKLGQAAHRKTVAQIWAVVLAA